MARKDDEAPMDPQDQQMADSGSSAAEMQRLIEEQQQIQERQEIERQARGMPGPLVASRSMDGPPNPLLDRIAFMEATGVPPYLIQAEKKSMEANQKEWAAQLEFARSQGIPEPPAPTIAAPDGGEMLSNGQQEADRILMSRMELTMENPPRRNGMTLEEQILNQPDETIPGGYYIVGGKKVDANGRILAA